MGSNISVVTQVSQFFTSVTRNQIVKVWSLIFQNVTSDGTVVNSGWILHTWTPDSWLTPSYFFPRHFIIYVFATSSRHLPNYFTTVRKKSQIWFWRTLKPKSSSQRSLKKPPLHNSLSLLKSIPQRIVPENFELVDPVRASLSQRILNSLSQRILHTILCIKCRLRQSGKSVSTLGMSLTIVSII